MATDYHSRKKLEERYQKLEDDVAQLEVENETLRKELLFFFTEEYIDSLLTTPEDTPISDIPASP